MIHLLPDGTYQLNIIRNNQPLIDKSYPEKELATQFMKTACQLISYWEKSKYDLEELNI